MASEGVGGRGHGILWTDAAAGDSRSEWLGEPRSEGLKDMSHRPNSFILKIGMKKGPIAHRPCPMSEGKLPFAQTPETRPSGARPYWRTARHDRGRVPTCDRSQEPSAHGRVPPSCARDV